MSKAFTRESDDEKTVPPAARPSIALPPGTPNYLTLDGAEGLRAERQRLVDQERPGRQRASPEESGGGEARRSEQRIREIDAILSTAQVVPPPPPPWEQVGFGVFVTVRMGDGEEVTYRLVGMHEVDLGRGWVSWLTPVAKALMNARVGERVALQLPGGRAEMEILGIAYPSVVEGRRGSFAVFSELPTWGGCNGVVPHA